MFDTLVATTTNTHGADAVDAWATVENAACARRLTAMLTLLDDAHAADGSADRDQWCIDNWAAVCAHLGATARLTNGAASALLLIAHALRERLPRIQALFTAGTIDYRLVRTIVYRSMLVTDPDALTALDTALAHALSTWAPMSKDNTAKTIDALIDQLDPDAVRRTHTSARNRSVEIAHDDGTGIATLFGTLFATDATALHTRLNAVADTACPNDPRTHDQRRADAIGTLAHGTDRLTCLCDTPDCPATTTPPPTGVTVYLIAHHDTLTRPPTPQGAGPDGDGPAGPDGDGPAGPDEDGGPDGDGPAGPDGDGPDAPDDPDTPDDPDDPAAPGPDPGSESPDAAVPEADSPAEYERADTTTDRADADADAGADAGASGSGSATNEHTSLDGLPPPIFGRPLRQMTLTDAYTACHQRPSHPGTIRPAALMGGHLLPGAIAHRAAHHGTTVAIIHPGHAPPEPHYRPSKKLADFIRCRDLTCRYPGCHVPATSCDIDHTIAWPHGPTQASNLKCLCRKHHLLKTFWTGNHGWTDRQHPNGNITWTTPDHREHTTTPGSRLLFPELSTPTAPAHTTGIPTARSTHTPGLAMPRRPHTRAQDRTHRITQEREHNKAATQLETQQPATPRYHRTKNRSTDDTDPPF